MAIIALQGIRGGVGTTSITAGLAWALHQLGERVLVIDFCAQNQLCLHFNSPQALAAGWARAELDGRAWHQEALRYSDGLDFLPFGQLTEAEYARWLVTHQATSALWLHYLQQLRDCGDYDWLLMDLPASESSLIRQWRSVADALFTVLTADANNHIRLSQQTPEPKARLLLNQLLSNSRLQQDLQQYWREHLAAMLPLSIHRDEAMAESLAAKQPVGEYSAVSLVSDELNVLAGWCLANVSKEPK